MAENQFYENLKELELHGAVNTNKELRSGNHTVVIELKLHGLSCAGKKIRPEFYDGANSSEKSTIQKKLVYECEVLSRLRHPNFVQFMGVIFVDHFLPLLVTEFLPITLSAHLKMHNFIPDPESYLILDDIAKGMSYLHELKPNPVVHGNLVANNILLTANKGAKISYFGEEKVLGLKLLQTVNLGHRIDIFSFGILMIHTFSGKCPIQSGNMNTEAELLLQKMDKEHPLKSLFRQCFSADEATCPKATDVQNCIQKVRVQHKIDNANVVQERAEWQKLMSNNQLQSDQSAEQSHTVDVTSSQEELVSLELEELKLKNSHMKKHIQKITEELDSKNITLKAKDQIIVDLLDSKRIEDAEVQKLHLKEKEFLHDGLLLREKLLHINEKRIEIFKRKMLHPLSMNCKLIWREAEEAPFGTTSSQHVVLGSSLYIGGGQSDSDDTRRTVLRYDTDQDKWDSLTPSPFMHFGLGHYAGKLITVGGTCGDGETSEVLCLSADGKEWVKCIPPMPTPRRRACVASHKAGIAVCGGVERGGHFSAVVEVFSQQRWHRACSLPSPRAALAAAIKDDILYVTGGYYPYLNEWQCAQEDCQYVNFPSLLACRAKKWESLPSLPVKCTRAVSHFGTLLAIGGVDAHSSTHTISNNVYAYNARIRSWVLVDKVEFGWSSMTTAMYNDDIIIVGGWGELVDGKQNREKCVMIGRYILQ